MGSAESVPLVEVHGGRRVVEYPKARRSESLNEKFDSFKLVEDHETESMIVQRMEVGHGKTSHPRPLFTIF